MSRSSDGFDPDEAFRELRERHPELAGDLREVLRRWQQGAVSLGLGVSASQHIRSRYGREADPEITLDEEADSEGGFSSETIERIVKTEGGYGRYRIKDEVARGGMGAILRAWDEDLRRHVAMKVILSESEGDRPSAPNLRTLNRFLEEAQITGQLEHPGIVPVHELGLDSVGNVYFTMRLVRGQTLLSVFDRARERKEGWSETRVLNVILRVCEAMAFAHHKGVIHRDLKPSNVMVGRFGEAYVMDWGLARVLEVEEDVMESRVSTGRTESSPAPLQSPMITMEGDAVGTPSYMSPEQARGELDRMGPRSDVYSIGAILYHLLSGRMPYVQPNIRLSSRAILDRVIEGPPPFIHRIAPGVPQELVAICEQAMGRDPEQRYASMEAMADDLRAYLEHRVVRAHRTGALAEFKKWVERNRATAVTLGALLLVLVSAGFVIAAVERERTRQAIRSLDEKSAAVLVAEADQLWPIHPSMVEHMESWLISARALVVKERDYRLELEELRHLALSWTEEEQYLDRNIAEQTEIDHLGVLVAMMRDEIGRLREQLLSPSLGPDRIAGAERSLRILEYEVPRHEERILSLEETVDKRRTWSFDDERTARAHRSLLKLVENLEKLSGPKGSIASVEERLEQVAMLRESLSSHASEWQATINSIRSSDECPLYGGLEIRPQLGLVPLRRNEAGLWEFWHVLSGAEPGLGPEGEYVIGPDTGIVLVLIPGGWFWMGAQREDGGSPCYDEQATSAETPAHETRLEPYFISKYELTQEQWFRSTGELPSETFAGLEPKGSFRISQTHPVEHVSWEEAVRILARWGLQLPTEAQWERAARGGMNARFWTGDTYESILPHVNSRDLSTTGLSTIGSDPGAYDYELIDDNWSHHAPVDSFTPNPFGLHHVLGNVWEWTLDWYCQSYRAIHYVRVDERSGELVPAYSNAKTYRGGGFESPLEDLRVTKRAKRLTNAQEEDIGVRPALRLDL